MNEVCFDEKAILLDEAKAIGVMFLFKNQQDSNRFMGDQRESQDYL